MHHALNLFLALLGVPRPDPPLSALAPFPPPAHVAACNEAGRAHLAWVEHERDSWNTDALRYELWDQERFATQTANLPWWHLGQAQDGLLGDFTRRGHLADLRKLIGEDSFAHGRMPCHLPIVWLQERD